MANAAIKQHVPIFISSTYEDLIPYREEVQRNLIRLEQIIKGMEYFGSNPKDSLTVCLSQVKESKLFIGILGMRYGSIDEESGLSYSELEYREAIKIGIPTLIYIMNENHPIPSKFVDKGEKATKLDAFKDSLKKRHVVSFFTTPDDLGKKLSKDLVDTLSRVEEINVNAAEILDVQKDDFADTVKKFILRPAKYQGFEGILTMRVTSELSGSELKDDIVKSFGLELGDTLSAYIDILSDDGRKINNRRMSVYADGEYADWLEKVSIGSIIKAQVKTAYCCIKEISRWDEGQILKNSSYTGLIITKGLSIERE